MRRLLLLIFLGCIVATGAGCTHRYDMGGAAFDIKSNKTVAVTTVDIRPYIRSGDKSPNFVGITRGGFGNPYNVTTASGRPLADDMTTSIVKSLAWNNVHALEVMTPPRTEVAGAREALLAADADRFVMLILREWKTDTYINMGMPHDVTLSILQRDGSEIENKTIRGRDNLGAPAFGGGDNEAAFRRKLETLFRDPRIVSALQ